MLSSSSGTLQTSRSAAERGVIIVTSRLTKIDVGRYVAEIERTLCAGGDRAQRTQALAILQRWQFDEMLDDASRQRAKVLIWRFAGHA